MQCNAKILSGLSKGNQCSRGAILEGLCIIHWKIKNDMGCKRIIDTSFFKQSWADINGFKRVEENGKTD